MPFGFVVLTLTAAVCFAAGNVLDKIIMTVHVDRPLVKVFWYGLLAPIVGLPALWAGAVHLPPLPVLGVTILAGALFMASLLLVMQAMKTGEVSRLALLKQTAPLFVLVFSFALLHEVLSLAQYAGVGLLLVAGLLSSLDHPDDGLPVPAFNRPFRLVLLASVLNALSVVFLKYALGETNVWTVFYGEQIGLFLLAPFILCAGDGVRREAWALARHPGRSLGMIAASSIVFAGAVISYTTAMNQASATLVAALNSINPLFTLLLVLALQQVGFSHFEERMTRSELVAKTLAVLLFAAGVYAVR